MAKKQIAVSASLAIGLGGSTAIADPDGASDRSDSEAAVEERADPERGGRFTLGAGFDPDDGFFASAAVANDNLFGRGQSLALSAMLSQRRQLFLLHFAEPHLGDTDLGLAVDLHNHRESWPGFNREAAGGALTLSHPIGERTRGFLSYRLEDVSIDASVDGAARRVMPGGRLSLDGGLISSLRLGIEHDSRDAPIFPRRGTSAGAWIEVADSALGSETELVRGRAWLGHHRPLGPLTLHLGGGVEGVTTGDPRGLPLSERLQLDGSRDLRGYAPGALGPTDPATGIALGGNLKMTARAELEFPIAPRAGLSGAVFVDAGALLDLGASPLADRGTSAGLGLLWRSPIGPIRIDLAFPFAGDRPQVLFSVGIPF